MTFKERYGPWALITGASSGVGAEFARQLAVLGLNVAIVARRISRLEELAQYLRDKNHIQVKIIAADLSQPDFLSLIVSETRSIEIGLLVNNAGFGLARSFLDHELEKGTGFAGRQLPYASCVNSRIWPSDGREKSRRHYLCLFRKWLPCDSL